MGQVFISNSRGDIDYEIHLIQTLETVRIDNWLDQEDIKLAADRRERIQAGIESADNLIDVINPASLQSGECHHELDLTIQNGKPLIPIVFKEIDPQPIPCAYIVQLDLFP